MVEIDRSEVKYSLDTYKNNSVLSEHSKSHMLLNHS